MIIGLMGFELESPNKGCEALVYSFLSILRDELENNSIIYNFSGTDLGQIPSYFNEYQFINIFPRVRDRNLRYVRALKRCDFIFDVTMGDSFSDIYSEQFCDWNIRHKTYAEFLCKKYVLLPQTYGPFNNLRIAKKASKVFSKAYMIYCRDAISQDLLIENYNIKTSILTSDMAFILPYDKQMFRFSQKKKIGINISGLLYKGGFESDNQFDLTLNYQELIGRLIDMLCDKYELHLIPHVIDLKEDSHDDDYKTCVKLHQKYPNTILAPAFDTPIQAKSYISNMDIFIGSRMHATIASFSSGVITIPISYSRKFEGLFGSLNYPYVVNAKKETTDSALIKINSYIDGYRELRNSQNESLKTIEIKNKLFRESISKLFERK